MVKSADDGSSSSSVAPFLKKCYEMVDDGSTDSVISWSRTGDNSFVIWDITDFSVRLLPKFFKHSNFSSFIRQLNIYGFRKVDADRWEFANDGFVRGQKDLLKTITRRKNVQSVEQRKSCNEKQEKNESEQPENGGLIKEVENLKSDRNVLMQELIKLRQYQETADGKLLHLKDRVQGMEESQQQMLSFLVMVMQNPSLLVQLLQPKENGWRMAEAAAIVEEVNEEGESVLPTGLPLVTYQPPLEGTVKPVMTPIAYTENSPNVSSDRLKDFIRNADMMKVCVDENHVPLIIPDLYDDGAWEKLLLLSPLKNNAKNSSFEEEEEEMNGGGDAIVELENDKSNMLELILREMEKSDDDFEVEYLDPEKSRSLDLLTEQMELLASEQEH